MARRDQFFTLTAFGAIPTHKYTAIPELVWWALRSKGQFSSKLQKIWHYNELHFTFTMSQTDYVIWICKARNLYLSLAYSVKAKILYVLFFLFYGLQMITDLHTFNIKTLLSTEKAFWMKFSLPCTACLNMW